jgi:hypothetical protein
MTREVDDEAVSPAPGEEPPPEPVWLDDFLERLLATGPAAGIAAARVTMAIAYEQGRWAVITALRERGIDYHEEVRRGRREGREACY